MPDENIYDKIIDIAKRRGFFWPSYEIYGGQAGFYDIGPYGTVLKRKIIELWRELFIKGNQDTVVEVETPIIGPSIVYEASGHVENFTDPIVRCNSCGRIFRADHLIEEKLNMDAEGIGINELNNIIKEKGLRCPVCNGELGEVKTFNLLFKTQIGPYEGNVGYIRPELAQGIFVAFKRIHESLRNKLPIGIAQVGKVGRNEISPRQGMIRLRDFTIMEMEYFFNPNKNECPNVEKYYNETLNILPYTYKENKKGFITVTVKEAIERNFVINPCMAYWMVIGKLLLLKIGVPETNMYFLEKGPKERAHYSSQTFDHMVKTSRWGWIEVAGYAYRGDYDLSRHKKYSNADIEVFEAYEEPVVMKVKKVLLDKAYAGKNFKSKAFEFMKKVEELDPDYVIREINEKGKINIDGIDVPKEALIIIEKEEKVAGRKFIPHVIEPSFGTDRLLYVLLEYAYREVDGRIVLSFPRYLSPVDAVVLPLIEDDEKLINKSKQLYSYLASEGFNVLYDDNGSIGKRYARADEIGIPVAFTIDYQTLEDNTVTMRDRDTWKQVRVSISETANVLKKFIYNSADLRELGKEVETKG
ncbi:glycyl-tRNA synthetase, dimeric type [Caldisphaera lagunensis DSM 15908]|uniref:Glycine--tRNA ligase n=1 Tax=Caldisphaera lagunensis (strain DSM 15908 / JCM 11604 / ANMR 0165 / IC-154) TaxID=1056495 RepID=L0ACG8_CALLD|nr:glycine--tRNA ligase [Caldisphaera lagunensis]AFZ70837.1 glycyl-tRNA synthetase, dimeric type [Caldisphaera lagunensis DSM 15908]